MHCFDARLTLQVVTLSQLKVFVLVARLGSVKAAASALGVSEPAVSQALAALRQHLGDPLLARVGPNMELTEAGRRVVGIASQMVNLATDAELTVRQSQGAPALLRVATTETIADAVGPSLLQAFASKVGNVEMTLSVASSEQMAALLSERLADVALGPRLSSSGGDSFESDPLLKVRLVFASAPTLALAANKSIAPHTLRDYQWVVDSSALDPTSEVALVLGRLRVPETRVRVCANPSAAVAAAAHGDGIVPAVEHLVSSEFASGALVRLAVTDTPIPLVWHVSTLATDRRPPIVDRFRRFLGTVDAMQAMHRVDGSVPVHRFRPPVHVTIWS